MGLAGPHRKTIKRTSMGRLAPSSGPHPWEKSGLSPAAKVIAFIETLPVTAGPLAGSLFKLRAWQKRFIRAIYATDKQDHRKVRTGVLSMGRGNGKTTLAAMLGLCHLAGPLAERRGEVYSAANDRFQAGRIFNEMAAIIERVPWLGSRKHQTLHQRARRRWRHRKHLCRAVTRERHQDGCGPIGCDL